MLNYKIHMYSTHTYIYTVLCFVFIRFPLLFIVIVCCINNSHKYYTLRTTSCSLLVRYIYCAEYFKTVFHFSFSLSLSPCMSLVWFFGVFNCHCHCYCYCCVVLFCFNLFYCCYYCCTEYLIVFAQVF